MKLIKTLKNIKFYFNNPITLYKTKSRFWGYFKISPCECGCTKFWGWGFQLGLFGFNILTKGKR